MTNIKNKTVILNASEGSMDSSAKAIRMTQESGRSMVEMLGTLAVIGVLSVAGIAGYTTAMNKYKANEILNGASVRAMHVSAKLQQNSEAEILTALSEFTDNTVGGATFGAAEKVGTSRFKIKFTKAPDSDICAQMIATAGKNGIIRGWGLGDNCAELTYNNDLTTTVIASDYKTESECKSPFKWCSGWATPGCADDCCTGVDSTCSFCNSNTGETRHYNKLKTCNLNGGTSNGVCDGSGTCVENTSSSEYNDCMDSESNESFCRCYAATGDWSYCGDDIFKDCIVTSKRSTEYCKCYFVVVEEDRCDDYDCEKWCNMVEDGKTMGYAECMFATFFTPTDEMCKCVNGESETITECSSETCSYTHCDCRTLEGKSYEECEEIW